MNDDRVASLLGEIRGLQRELLGAYGRALQNQQDAIRMQRQGVRRARILLGVIGVILLVLFVVVLVLLRYAIRHYS